MLTIIDEAEFNKLLWLSCQIESCRHFRCSCQSLVSCLVVFVMMDVSWDILLSGVWREGKGNSDRMSKRSHFKKGNIVHCEKWSQYTFFYWWLVEGNWKHCDRLCTQSFSGNTVLDWSPPPFSWASIDTSTLSLLSVSLTMKWEGWKLYLSK